MGWGGGGRGWGRNAADPLSTETPEHTEESKLVALVSPESPELGPTGAEVFSSPGMSRSTGDDALLKLKEASSI